MNTPSNTDFSFGQWLRRRRGGLGLTQAEFAKQLGCALITLRKFEAEERRPSQEMAERMAMVLHVPPEETAVFVRFARGELQAGEHLSVSDADAASSDGDPRTQLPLPPYAIIGREDMLARAGDAIATRHARVLTLVGPPGVGKTRLALELAHRLHSSFAHGAAFVELAPVRDASLVPGTVAESLRIENNTAADTTAAVVAALRDRRMLLVLDNFEHVIDAAPFVAELVAACVDLVCVVTSRERLRIRAEHALQVNVLELPTAGKMTLDAVQAAPASRLFITRANEVNAELHLTDADAPAIAELCMQLEGLPLALELLAARADVFTPAGLLADLRRGLSALEDAPRDLPERHRGLRAAIEWSLQLMSESQRALFTHLAVFAGGFNTEAAQAVFPHPPTHLVALAHASLIQPLGADRWRMLEPIRQFAEEALWRGGEAAADAIRLRHAAHFAEVAQGARDGLLGSEAEHWTARLEADHANLQAALRWSLHANRPEVALRIAVGVFRFWHRRGLWREALAWLEEALQLDEYLGKTTPLDIRAKAAHAAGVVAHALGQYDRAERQFQASLELANRIKDDEQVAATYVGFGILRKDQGRFDEALTLFDQAIPLQPEHALMIPWQSKADMLRRLGRFDEAESLFEHAMALNRNIGDDEGLAHNLRGLGEIAYRRGDADSAEKYVRENEILCRKLNSERGLSWTAHHLADIARVRGEWAEAAERYADALAQMNRLGDRYGVCEALTDCAQLAVATGHYHLAARWLGMARAGFDALGAKLTPYKEGLITDTLNTCTQHLDAQTMQQAADKGAQDWRDADIAPVLDALQTMF